MIDLWWVIQISCSIYIYICMYVCMYGFLD
jgi:hypothetical protein